MMSHWLPSPLSGWWAKKLLSPPSRWWATDFWVHWVTNDSVTNLWHLLPWNCLAFETLASMTPCSTLPWATTMSQLDQVIRKLAAASSKTDMTDPHLWMSLPSNSRDAVPNYRITLNISIYVLTLIWQQTWWHQMGYRWCWHCALQTDSIMNSATTCHTHIGVVTMATLEWSLWQHCNRSLRQHYIFL